MTPVAAETADGTNLDQALTAAMTEHSKPAEQTPEAAGAVKAEPAGETKAEEKKAQPEQQTAKAADAQKEPAEEQLLTDEEFSKLGTDVAAIRKGMNKAFTTKTQALAAERKALQAERDGVAQYKNLIEGYERNPGEVIRLLAEHHGFDIKPKGAAAAQTELPATGAAETADDTTAVLRQALGPELEGLADALAPAIQKLVTRQATNLVDQRVRPLEAKNQARDLESAKAQMQADFDALTARHPDWREYKPAMDALVNKIHAGPGATSAEYLDTLYELASKDARAAKAAKAVVEKINKIPENAEAAGSGVAAHTVSSTPAVVDLDTAIQMALRGQTVEG